MTSRSSAATRKPAKGEYIETDSGNKVSRRANISGTASITLGGRTVIQAGVHLRGDLHRLASDPTANKNPTSISIGRCTVVSNDCIIKPPSRVSRGIFTFYPMKIGDNVFIGPNSIVSSASISSHVYISNNCVLQPFCVIKENCKIFPFTVVPAYMTVAPGSVVGGQPGRVIGEVGEGWGVSPGTAGGGGTAAGEWVEGGDLRALVSSIR